MYSKGGERKTIIIKNPAMGYPGDAPGAERREITYKEYWRRLDAQNSYQKETEAQLEAQPETQSRLSGERVNHQD